MAGRFGQDTDPDVWGDLAVEIASLAAAVDAEQARRRQVAERAARVAAYQVLDASGDDPRWTPQPGDHARLAGGPDSGWRGRVIGLCNDGCMTDGQPRWLLHNLVAGSWQSCVPRHLLRPVPTVRRPGAPGRSRCDYQCRCCMAPPAINRRAGVAVLDITGALETGRSVACKEV